MKSKIVMTFVFTLMVSLFTLNNSAFAEQFGVVDINKIITNYNQSKIAIQDIKTKKVNLQKFVDNARKSVQAAKTPTEKKNLENKYNAELKQKITTMNQEQNKKGQIIQANIVKAIKSVAAQKQLTTVLTKDSVIVGGTEITNEVITLLNTPSAQ